MKPALSFALAAGLAVAAGSAFAQNVGNPVLGTPPHALGSPAPAPAPNPAGQAAAKPAASVNGYNPENPEASSATDALNLLEARGYANFSNFTADGNGFRATVVNGGRASQVSIDPRTGTVGGV